MENITPFKRQIWVRKTDISCYPTIVLLAALTESRWYFGNGCFRHMTGNSSHLCKVTSHSGSVRFGDDQKGKIVGKRTLNVPGLPHLEDVLMVQGLKTNLISISQLCDQNWNVCFNKDQCHVLDKSNRTIIEGTRSSYNCYILTNDLMCNRTKS